MGPVLTTALFWNYLMEQLGNNRAEPGVGTDFVREFWQNAEDAGADRDFLGTLRSTIADFDTNATLEGLFHDFTVANYTKLMDLSVLPDATKYRYVDEQQPGATPYDDVPVTDVGTIPPSVGPTALSVDSWAATYLQADIGDCTGVARLVVDGDRAGVALASQDGSGTVQRLDESVGTHFARAILVRTRAAADKRITRLGAVVTGLNDSADVDYGFACGSYQLAIKKPTQTDQAFVGTKDAPRRFQVRVQVHGPSDWAPRRSRGAASDFTAEVGTKDAHVVSGDYVQGEYWLTIKAPSFPAAAADVQDLTVHLGDVSASNVSSVSSRSDTSTRCSPSTGGARCSTRPHPPRSTRPATRPRSTSTPPAPTTSSVSSASAATTASPTTTPPSTPCCRRCRGPTAAGRAPRSSD